MVSGLGLHPLPATCSRRGACPSPSCRRTRTTKIGPREPPSWDGSGTTTAGNAAGSG
ncbi:hypothetical protein I79_000148 [Cricetulus griseus]|uniref:Uncharacterized protein n=1 Tax=Cricetulus griseus TaxID=10029 RepID=G3GRK0_CRIGR|nr:hypothetical protein I79_000148 [Cricetulus griseus]